MSDADKLAERMEKYAKSECVTRWGVMIEGKLKAFITEAIAPLFASNAVMEAELADAAKVLQAVLPIGQVKHIGLLEVAAGVQRLAEDNAAMEAVLRECRPFVHRKHSTHHAHCGCRLVACIDALTAKGAGQ